MKQVKAIKAGFYETLRQEGDVFFVPDDLTASWFEAVQEEPKPKGKKDDDKPA